MTANIFSVHDLLFDIATRIPTAKDLSALSRCNRTLHSAALPHLYRDVEFSIYKVDSLAAALRSDNALAQYCRKLTMDCKGTPVSKEQEHALASCPIGGLTEEHERILSKTVEDLIFVMTICLERGKVKDLTWDNTSHRYKDFIRIWERLSPSNLSLKRLRINGFGDEGFYYKILVSLL